MNQLLLTLTEIGHLPHGERWVLGVFLKQLGMSAEDQKRFWYQRAVDNIGLTFEDFSAKVGYSIDHLYGKVGSGVDYNTPKCETIISTYFCPFAKKSADEIGMRFQKEFEKKHMVTKMWIVSKGYTRFWYDYYFDKDRYELMVLLCEMIDVKI